MKHVSKIFCIIVLFSSIPLQCPRKNETSSWMSTIMKLAGVGITGTVLYKAGQEAPQIAADGAAQAANAALTNTDAVITPLLSSAWNMASSLPGTVATGIYRISSSVLQELYNTISNNKWVAGGTAAIGYLYFSGGLERASNVLWKAKHMNDFADATGQYTLEIEFESNGVTYAVHAPCELRNKKITQVNKESIKVYSKDFTSFGGKIKAYISPTEEIRQSRQLGKNFNKLLQTSKQHNSELELLLNAILQEYFEKESEATFAITPVIKIRRGIKMNPSRRLETFIRTFTKENESWKNSITMVYLIDLKDRVEYHTIEDINAIDAGIYKIVKGMTPQYNLTIHKKETNWTSINPKEILKSITPANYNSLNECREFFIKFMSDNTKVTAENEILPKDWVVEASIQFNSDENDYILYEFNPITISSSEDANYEEIFTEIIAPLFTRKDEQNNTHSFSYDPEMEMADEGYDETYAANE